MSDSTHNNPHNAQDNLWHTWYRAASNPAISTEVVNLYNQLSEDIRDKGATCLASGNCCKFETFGHRLYVTGFEIAWVLHQLNTRQPHDTNNQQPSSSSNLSLNVIQQAAQSIDENGAPIDGCTYQQNNLCMIHEIRPLGCRIYYCDQNLQEWQNDLYETYLRKLRDIHAKHDLPYRYMEWRTSLEEASRKLSIA